MRSPINKLSAFRSTTACSISCLFPPFLPVSLFVYFSIYFITFLIRIQLVLWRTNKQKYADEWQIKMTKKQLL